MTATGLKIGDYVKWSSGRKPLGKIVRFFNHKSIDYAIVENDDGVLSVVKVSDNLVSV